MLLNNTETLEYWKGRTDRTLDQDSNAPDAVRILTCRDRDAESIDPATLSWVRRRLQARAVPPSVLDVGCGFGRWAVALDGAAGEYLGVDVVPRRIEWAHQNFPSGRFQEVSAEGRWQLGRKFDVVLFAAVLQHLPMGLSKTLLRTAADHLESGGVMLLAEWGFTGLPEGPPKWNQAPDGQSHDKDFNALRKALHEYAWSGVNGRLEVRR